MSGWTVVTVRGKKDDEYEHSKYDGADRSPARSDIAASMDSDDRVADITTDVGHVYAHLRCRRYDFDFAESLFEDYEEMIDDAVVLGANDTTGTGCARYYPRPDLGMWTDQYEEHGAGEEGAEGQIAVRVITARHGIIARDPFGDDLGRFDDRRIENGTDRVSD